MQSNTTKASPGPAGSLYPLSRPPMSAERVLGVVLWIAAIAVVLGIGAID